MPRFSNSGRGLPPNVARSTSAVAGDFAAKKLGMRTMVASDIREHFSAAICFLDPLGEQP